jgi:hypothetical protein
MKISRYWKAVVAAVAAGAGTLATAMNDDLMITLSELVSVGLTVLSAYGITWAVPNRTASPPGEGRP